MIALAQSGLSVFAAPTPVTGPTNFASDDAFLGYVEQQTFNYFWNEANPANGLISLRSDQPNTAAIGAVGFGLSAICAGIDHGWITRDQGRARVLAALTTLYNGPQGSGASGYTGYHGWFYHQLNINTGLRNGTIELSSSDTAILLSGVIDVGIYFNDPINVDQATIRTLSSNIFNRVDFQFMLKTNDNTVYQQWTPEMGFTNVSGYKGYNQVAYLYIYGLGAPTNPLPAASWAAWVSGFNWKTYYGYSYAYKAQLFGYQYSHCWIDFLGIPDAYMQGMGSDYFQNSRRATLAQQAYAIDNPPGYPNYGSNEWGYTSCSGPDGYDTLGAPGGTDNGTIAPTAAAGSMPFAPEVCLPTIRHMYDTYTNLLWTTEGFRDSFNVASNNFFNTATLAIDEGPIILMIENYRTGSVWQRMLSSPIIQRGLQRAGFPAPPPYAVTAMMVSSNQISVSWSGVSTYQTGYQVQTSTNGVNYAVATTVSSNVYSAAVSWPSNVTCFIRVVTTSPAGLSGARQTVIVPGAGALPAVALSSPSDGSSYPAPAAITLVASVAANGHYITQVNFYNGSAWLASDTNAPYIYNWTNVNAGSYNLGAQAVYDSGSTVASATAAVTVTNLATGTPPVVALTSPSAGSSFLAPAAIPLAASVIANGHNITQVSFFSGSIPLGSAISAPYTLTWNSVGAASYNLSAQAAYDSGSIVTSSIVTVIVTNPLPNSALNIYDPFNYIVGTALDGQGGWYLSGSISLGTIEAGNLSVPGLAGAMGNRYTWPVGSDSVRLPFGATITNGAVYFSFALRIDQVGSFTGHDTFAGLALGAATTYFPKIDAVCNSSNAYQIAIYKGSGTTYGSVASPTFTTNDVVFIVARYSINASSSTDDTCDCG